MSTALLRHVLNFWPPLLFSGIRATRIASNWREVDVELRLRWWNRNAAGTMFGGSLFAMTDAFYPLMLRHALGPGYAVWTQSAEIRFIAPGLSVAHARFRLSDEQLASVRAAASGGERHLTSFPISIVDALDKPIAEAIHVVYVRRKRSRGASGGALPTNA